MKRWMWLLLAIFFLAGGSLLCLGGSIAVSLFGYPQTIQDRLDQRSLRRQFDLPSGLRLIEYDGYPAVVGFGQREGLNIQAVYQLGENQVEEFNQYLVNNGWLPLPVSIEIRDKIKPYVTPDSTELSSGLYLCRAAGHNVLHARETRPYAEVDWLNDVIFGAFDANTKRLYLQVGSGY